MIDDPLVNGSYHSSLSSCFSDCASCFYGMFCPCCLNASNLSAIRKENCTAYHCLFGFSPFWIRQLVQDEYNIHNSYCSDCFITTVCCSCAICQDSREIQWRRLNSMSPNK